MTYLTTFPSVHPAPTQCSGICSCEPGPTASHHLSIYSERHLDSIVVAGEDSRIVFDQRSCQAQKGGRENMLAIWELKCWLV